MRNQPYAARRLPGHLTKPNCVSSVPAVCVRFSKKPRKRLRRSPRHRFKANWPYLQTMLRLVRAYERGEYKQISNDDLTWIVSALNYLVDQFDLIPDKIPFLGFVDDAIVVGFVADKTRQTLDDFMIWETNGVQQSWVTRLKHSAHVIRWRISCTLP